MPARVNKCVNQNFVVISRQATPGIPENRGYCTILTPPPVYAGEDLTSLSRSPVASLRISASMCFQIWPARTPRHTLVLSPDRYASRGRWQGRSADYTKFRAAGHPPVLGGDSAKVPICLLWVNQVGGTNFLDRLYSRSKKYVPSPPRGATVAFRLLAESPPRRAGGLGRR